MPTRPQDWAGAAPPAARSAAGARRRGRRRRPPHVSGPRTCEHAGDVVLDRADAEEEGVRDLAVAEAGGEQRQDLGFPPRQGDAGRTGRRQPRVKRLGDRLLQLQRSPRRPRRGETLLVQGAPRRGDRHVGTGRGAPAARARRPP